MKTKTKDTIKKMEMQLGHTLMLMKFRFINLCVKSEAASLLTVKVQDPNEGFMDIEKVANVGILDDDNMLVSPFDDNDMNKLRLAIMKEHPEFKQHIETIDLDEATEDADKSEQESDATMGNLQIPETPVKSVLPNDEEENLLHVLVLTVPAVDDDRRKLLLEAVKVQVDECKDSMKYTIDKTKVEVGKQTIGLSIEEIKEADDKLKEAAEQYEGAVDEAYEDKKKEIEEAYQRYLEKQGQQQSPASADDNDENNAFSMKFED